MAFDCIIPLGATCNITFLLRNAKLNKETTLFEWFVSNRLNNITNVLLQLETDILIPKDKGVCMIDENIYSPHYTYDVFKDIFIRRRDRLIKTIQSNRTILFIRFEGDYNMYTEADIDDFAAAIRGIRPDCEFKLLLITPNKDIPDHPLLITEFYDKHPEDRYCQGEINQFFRYILDKHEFMPQESP